MKTMAAAYNKSKRHHKAFTLIELLSVIALLAVISVVAVVFISNYLKSARKTAHKQTLAVLNRALNRYKMEGGDINALTEGAPISHILTALRTPVTWGYHSHQFLQDTIGFNVASLQGEGNRVTYHFDSYGDFDEDEPASYDYTLKLSTNASGATTTGAGWYDANDSVTVTVAGADAGWSFLGWYNKSTDTLLDSNLSYNFNINANLTLEARYIQADAIAVTSAATNVTLTGDGYYTTGDSVTVTATAETSPVSSKYSSTNPHWIFNGWYDTNGDTLVSSDTSYTFSASGDITLEAKYNLATSATTGVWYEWDLSTGQAPFGGFTTTNTSGMDYIYWYPDTTTSAANVYMEAEVSENIAIDATYVMYLYMITAKTGVTYTQTRHFTRLYPNLSWNSYSQGYNGSWVNFSSNSGTAATFLGSYSNNGTGAYSVPGASGSISNLTQNITSIFWAFDEDLSPVIRFHR